MVKEPLYRVRFINQDKLFEVYARQVFQGDMYGFVVLKELVWDSQSSLVVDPSAEKLRSEFDGVEQTIVPMHSVVRIDQVTQKGPAKIAELSGKVAQFPSPIYTPGSSDS